MNFLKRLISIFAGFFIFSTASSQEKPKIHMFLIKVWLLLKPIQKKLLKL